MAGLVLDLGLQLGLEGTGAEDEEPGGGAALVDQGPGLEQQGVPLAGDQLGDHGDDEVAGLEAELGEEALPGPGGLAGGGIDAAADGAELGGGDALAFKLGADGVGDGDDPVVGQVLEAADDGRVRVVHPAGEHRGDAGDGRGEAAEEIRAPAAVGVEQVGL